MKILFLTPYPPNEAPSQRFRFEQYIDILSKQGNTLVFSAFLNSQNWQLFFKSGKPLHKLMALLEGYLKRFLLLFRITQFDFVFIHREATPLGPPIIEWIIARVFKKKIIYDFDDAIWLTDKIREPVVIKWLKWRTKVASICGWSHVVSCGNQYLCDYASKFNKHVVNNPTTIDTQRLHKESAVLKQKKPEVIIGWTGSHSTLKYLNDIFDVLSILEKKYNHLKFLVIADRPPQTSLPALQFLPWSKETEIVDLSKVDIGIMPLPDDEWSNGKCGFKALQYMALRIPTVASAVGVNGTIIDQNVNGFLCSTKDEWIASLEKLIIDDKLRERIGESGRKKVVARYSVVSNTSNFLSLFE